MMPMKHFYVVGPLFPAAVVQLPTHVLRFVKYHWRSESKALLHNTYHRNLSIDPSNKEETLPGPSYAGAGQNSQA